MVDKKYGLIAAIAVSIACGSEFNMPISLPNPVGVSSTEELSTPVSEMPSPGMRNEGTQVWIVPVPAGDMMKLAQQPDLWPRAASRTDVVSLYGGSAYHHPGYECSSHCGPNSYQALVNAVPGGMFKWLSDRFILAMEMGSIKEFACTQERLPKVIAPVIIAINNIKAADGRLTYLSLDEPFMAGTNTTPGLFGGDWPPCALTATEVARLQKMFNDEVHAVHPEVKIGLIEPYPHFSVDQIMSFINELEAMEIRLPYFHLDFDQPRAVSGDHDWKRDIRRLHEFCRAKGIPFSVILWGWDGRSNEQFAISYWNTTRATLQAVGVTEHTVLQSWAGAGPGTVVSGVPDTVPETSDVTHTGLLLRTLDFLNIRVR